MKSLDLSNYNLRCVCGASIEVTTWPDYSRQTSRVSMRAHGKRYDQEVDDFELERHVDPTGLIIHILRQGESALGKECPTRAPIPFNTVTAIPEDPQHRRPERFLSMLPFLAPTPPPSINPAFGKPVARRIIK